MYNFPKIQFGDKDFYVVDRLEYNGVTYLYIYEDVYEEGMDIENFAGDIEINFIFKRDDGNFENVVDDKLFNELLTLASKRLLIGKNNYFNEKK